MNIVQPKFNKLRAASFNSLSFRIILLRRRPRHTCGTWDDSASASEGFRSTKDRKTPRHAKWGWSFIVTVLFLGLINIFPDTAQAQSSDWENAYGVEFAETGDFPDLAARGANTILVNVGNTQTSWLNYFSAAVNNNIKLIPMIWGNNQTSWSWNTANNEWELNVSKYPNSLGAKFISFLKSNPVYLNAVFALYSFHEPFNPENPSGMVSVERQKKFWDQIHNEEFPNRTLKLYGESISHTCPNGCADYDHATLYSFSYCGGNGVLPQYVLVSPNGPYYEGCTSQQTVGMDYARRHLDWYYNKIHGSPPAPDGTYTKIMVLVQSYAFDNLNLNYWNRMPTAQEMYDWGNQVVSQRKSKIAGMLWYVYRFGTLYQHTLQKDRYDGLGQDRWLQINEVAQILLNSGPPPAASASINPSLVPSTTPAYKNPDLNGDGFINSTDLKQLLSTWGPISATTSEDLDSNGKINAKDAGVIIAKWQDGPF